MNPRTAERLIAINRAFYGEFAVVFDATRRSPWPGWNRVLRQVERDREITILDLGCGNGRFGRFAESELGGAVRYFGVDTSAELLQSAGESGGPSWTLIEADVLADSWPPEVATPTFDLVVCFGVLHHIPGESNRRALVGRMADRVGEAGMLAVSFWQFGADERFGGRIVPWPEAGLAGIDEQDLEPGDTLLRWGQSEALDAGTIPPVRYCHHCPPDEAERLTRELGLTRIDTYLSDGRSDDLNLYHLLART